MTNPIKLKTTELDNCNLVEFEIDGGVCNRSNLVDLDPPEVNAPKGVVISGRGPVWLFGYLIHHYHPTAFVATFDPNQGGGVVVQTHKEGISVGDLIELPKS